MVCRADDLDLQLILILSALVLADAYESQKETRVPGISRQKRLNLVANETEILDQVAKLMSQVRKKDVGKNESKQFTDDEDSPYFSVFPETQHFDRIHVRVHREPLGFLWRKLYFEDFYEFNNLWPQFKTTTLELNTTTLIDPNTNPADFYFQAAKNLKSALPNLKNIQLGGGYHFESENETTNDLIDKLSNTKNNIAQIIEALKYQGLNISFDNFSIDFVISERLVEQLENDILRQQLGQIFQPTCLKWLDNVYTLKFLSQDVVTRLTVTIGSRLPRREFKPTCINQTVYSFNSTEDEDLLSHKNDSHSPDQVECLKEVFEPNTTRISADNIYLEDFIDASNFQPQQQLESLNMSVSVACSPFYSHDQFYSLAIENLKRTAPNLKSIGLYGTLRVYPNISSLYELRTELLEIKRSMEAMNRYLHQEFEKVEWIEDPFFIFSVDKQILKRIQASDLVKALEVFNYSELDIDAGKINVKLLTDTDVEYSLNIMINALFPKGYSFH